MNYLGQLVDTTKLQGFSFEQMKEMSSVFKGECKSVEVYVTSQNSLKVQAAQAAVGFWLNHFRSNIKISITGLEVISEIDEQPHGYDQTLTGAKNRLKNMKNIILKDHIRNNNVLHILISLENGLFMQNIEHVNNPETFLFDNDHSVYVDRCVAIVEMWFNGNEWISNGVSQGVTTPRDAVILSEKSNWSQTAGFFIAEKYGWNPKDWHLSICGKGRQTIMEDLIKSIFRLPYSFPIPCKISNFKPDLYLQYVTEPIDFFCSSEISDMLKKEKEEDDDEDSKIWRGFYSTINQPIKAGADGVNPPNSNGIILTEDLLVCYFDQIDGQDILHVILLWVKPEENFFELGWVLPGKRDRAYDKNRGDISVEDANYSLVEKEIGDSRSSVAYHFIIGYFDDRKREQRMKSSGFVSFVLLNEKPQLIPGVRIGVPLNALVQLVKHEILIPKDPIASEMFGLIRNHDSLLLNIFETTKFYHILDKIKIAQSKWRELQKSNIQAKRPAISEFNSGFDCPICQDLLVNSRIICYNGHCICDYCLNIYNNNNCPICRQQLLPFKIPNRSLEHIIQNQYPKKYAERYNEIYRQQPNTWREDLAFNGKVIQYY
jgi:non-canonical (house-cleaning) NTP pyrophosphatase